MALETCRTPSISRPMRSSMSLIISASRSNSSPRPESFTRCAKSPAEIAAEVVEILASVRRNRLRTMSAPAAPIATTISSAQSSASVSRLPELRPDLDVPPDQQMKAARQIEATAPARANASRPAATWQLASRSSR